MRTVLRGAGAVLALALATGAQAQAILQPVGATTSLGSFSSQYLPAFAIDQSGLSASYVSGVTDFDAYVAATRTVAGGSSFNTWFSSAGLTTGSFDFALGGPRTISAFALWTDPQPTPHQGIRAFTLIAGSDAAFTTPTLLGSYVAAEGAGDATNVGQVFAFAPTSASYVRMEILSNYGSTFVTGMVEGAFRLAPAATVTPEPTSVVLVGGGLLSLAALRRRRRG